MTEIPLAAIEAAAKALNSWTYQGQEERAATIALTAALPHMTGWRPIETAPKDGTRFLFSTATGFRGLGFFINGAAFAADSWRGERDTTPISWMPLPAPPETEK